MTPAICLIQPPFVQLNSPYPSIYYLRSFLEKQGRPVLVRDHSIALFNRIFCREGLERIFSDARRVYETGIKAAPASGENPLHIPDFSDKDIRRGVKRFLSEEGRWLSSIDRLTAFLRGGDREWGHFLALANGALPGGPRFDAALAALGGEAAPDQAPLLASAQLADLADFITVTLDPGFSLIRYLPHIAGRGFRDFSGVKKSLNGYIPAVFYRPWLEEEWRTLESSLFQKPPGPPTPTEAPATSRAGQATASGRPPQSPLSPAGVILGITIPFSGCLAGALACAESAKSFFGARALTVAGGGYVNTELRFIGDEQFFDYFDYLSLDRGYGSWEAILERAASGETPALTRPSTRPSTARQKQGA
jgi:hypothetical protein